MIYFDNAATTKVKPESVYDSVNYYLREVGVSPGRGSYKLGVTASRMLYQSRCTVGDYFGLSRNDRVIFTKCSTEAINLFFKGLLKKGDHVVTTCYEHNAVLRPLHQLKQEGMIDYSVISRDDLNLDAGDLIRKYVRDNTRVLAMTLASNLTGRIVFNQDLISLCHRKGIITFVDSSQGAGKIPLDMKHQGIDFLAFTSHKDLLGIPGAGGLCCESHEMINPLIQGGTGIHGDEYVNPDVFPEGYEAGTLNMPAIWALKNGIEFVCEKRTDNSLQEKSLIEYIVKGLQAIPGVTVYDADYKRVPTCCFTIDGISSDKVVTELDNNEICVRGGIHCAILAHEAIGTVSSGAVRVSINYNNTIEEANVFLDKVKGMVK